MVGGRAGCDRICFEEHIALSGLKQPLTVVATTEQKKEILCATQLIEISRISTTAHVNCAVREIKIT